MRHSLVLALSFALLPIACRNAEPEPAAPASPAAPATSVAAQVEHGGRVYAAHCAGCHGDAGQGKKGPPLVGAGALPLDPRPEQELRKIRFHTALDVATFVTKEMPPKASERAKLAEKDYWAVLAFALNANKVPLKEPVGPANAKSIVLHP